MATNLKVQGYVAPGFELVVEAFKENFATGDELGASYGVAEMLQVDYGARIRYAMCIARLKRLVRYVLQY